MSKEIKSWKVIKEEWEIKNPWIGVKKVSFELPTGTKVEDYFIVEKSDVVVIVTLNSKGKVYLIREYERGVTEIGHKFPAGHLDEEETPKEAAKRELREELGLDIGKLTYLGTTYVEPGFMTNRAHYYLAENLSESSGKGKKEPSELFEGSWVKWEVVEQMIDKGEIKNPFVIVASRLFNSYRESL